jgi:hypothetical protein
MGAEETPSTLQSRDAARRGVRASATEQKRNVRQSFDDDACQVVEEAGGIVETAVPRGARANRCL